MSTFRVYGMTEAKARQIARSLAPKNNESIEDYETRVQERFEKLMNGGKEVPLSAAFDAPQFARQFIDIARRSGRCRNLHIKYPVQVKAMRKNKPVMKTVWTTLDQ
ncbi:hypothetical protein [Vreelandella populi]|uniref:hypothetical protein n=1 Tax=Vreelandella populi TaxID=2498858 RepID=UPI000F8E20B0|nr:hypothetical protein [Halomonas populi]RUR51496.1 hypothetical protein ELY40_17015 [Halomonas populi]